MKDTKATMQKDWKQLLNGIINEHIKTRNGNQQATSIGTQIKRRSTLFNGFQILRDLGYKIGNPRNFSRKHIEVLCQYWEEKRYSASTIQNNISTFKIYCEWIGRNEIINASKDCVKNHASVTRTYAAQYDKSPSAFGIEIGNKINEALSIDSHVGMQMKAVHAFGLRKKEAIMFRPFLAEKDHELLINRGTKGNRKRTLKIETAEQKQILAELKQFIRDQGLGIGISLGNPDYTLAQNINRYSYVMNKIGLTKSQLGTTMHGVRASFANSSLERRGVVPTVRGGSGIAATKELTQKAYMDTAEDMGHSRINIIAAYAGSTIVRKAKE